MSRLTPDERARAKVFRDELARLKRHYKRDHDGTLLACSTCGCLDIQLTAWVEANSGEPTGDEGPSADVWCPECETHTDDGFCIVELKHGRVVASDFGCRCPDLDCRAVKGLHTGTKYDQPQPPEPSPNSSTNDRQREDGAHDRP